VGDGQLWFPREIISRVLKGLLIEEDLNRLTSREIEIVRLVGSGLNNQEIADKLFISRETVRWHVRALHAKLGTKDRDSLREYVRYLRSSEPKIPSASVESRRRSVAS
jgi:NarL family two-component system response regulator LiaR